MRFPITVHFIVQLGSVRKCLKFYLDYSEYVHQFFPSIITAMAFLSYFYLQVLNANFHHKHLECIRSYMHGILDKGIKWKLMVFFDNYIDFLVSTKISMSLTFNFCFEVVAFTCYFWNKNSFHFIQRVLSLPYETR